MDVSLSGTLQSLAVTLLLLAGLLRLVARALSRKQADLLYFPEMPPNSRRVVPQPHQFELRGHKLAVATQDKLTLHGFFIPVGDESRPQATLIHFHGNAGNIGHRLPLAQMLVAHLGVNVVLAEYRGYGLSSDAPEGITEEGLMKDARAFLEHVRGMPQVDSERIVLHGSSLGGAVCVQLASECPGSVAALVVENTFTSIGDMVDVLLADILMKEKSLSPARKAALALLFSSLLKPIVLALRWRSVDRVGSLAVPTLFISGTADEIVPSEQMRTLYNKCGAPGKRIAIIEGGRHNETYYHPDTLPAIAEFLRENVRTPQAI